MFLVVLHPENENYQKIEVFNMQKKVKQLLDYHYETKIKNSVRS